MKSTRGRISLRDVWDNYSRVADSYKPLTLEQERALIAAERHDEEHLRDLLIYHNIAAARFIARKYCTSRVDSLDDAMQRAMVGLYEASRAFDLDRGNRFLTYAAWKIIHKVQYPSLLCNAEMDERTVSMDEPLSRWVQSMDNDRIAGRDALLNVAQEADVVNDGSEVIDKLNGVDWRMIVLGIVDTCTRFSESNRDIFKRYMELGLKSLVAKEYGISHERVRQIVNKVLEVVLLKLGRNFSDDEEIANKLKEFSRREEEDERRPEKPRRAVVRAARSQVEERLRAAGAIEAIEAVKAIEAAEGIDVPDAPERRVKRRPKIPSFNLMCLRTGVTKYDRIDCTRQRRPCRLRTHWRPECFERYLKDLYYHHSMRTKAANPPCVEAADDGRVAGAALSLREDGEAGQELFVAEMDALLARIDERQISQGSHFDDMYELRDEN